MTRALQLLIVLLAALACAGCTAWAMSAKHAELKRIEQDWGVYKPDPFNPNTKQHNG
jgi:hypothetical protein